jgi:hypothetical protein
MIRTAVFDPVSSGSYRSMKWLMNYSKELATRCIYSAAGFLPVNASGAFSKMLFEKSIGRGDQT